MNQGLIRHIVSIVFVFSVAGFAYYEYKKTKSPQQHSKNHFLKQELSDLSQVKIQKSNQTLWMVRDQQEWFLKKPIKDLASFSEVSRWFDEIKIQPVEQLELEGDIPWDDYHIGQFPTVLLKFLDGSEVQFTVSSKGSFDDKFFIKKAKKLYKGEKYFSNEINSKDFQDFRNKKIIPSYGHAIQVQIQKPRFLSLNWKRNRWSIKDKDFPLSQKNLDLFWSELSTITASAIKEKATPASLSQYGLNNPAYQMSLAYSKKRKVIIKVSALKGNKAYVFASHRDYILEISKDYFEKMQISKNGIRDHGAAFRYPKHKVSDLELNFKKTYLLSQKKGAWKLKNPDKKKGLDFKNIQILMNSIYELKGVAYKKGTLSKVTNSVIAKNSKGDILLDLKAGPLVGSRVWIQSNLSKDLVALPVSAWNSILEKDIFVSQEVKIDPKLKEKLLKDKEQSKESKNDEHDGHDH